MDMNSVLKLAILVVVFNSANARNINITPLTQECRNTIQDVFFEGKDSVKFSDWSRIFLEQGYKATNSIRLAKLVSGEAVNAFIRIDLNKNELIEVEEFQKKYLDKIKGYLFLAGNTLLSSDGWSTEKINENTHNCEFFNPLMTQDLTFELDFVKITQGERPDVNALVPRKKMVMPLCVCKCFGCPCCPIVDTFEPRSVPKSKNLPPLLAHALSPSS